MKLAKRLVLLFACQSQRSSEFLAAILGLQLSEREAISEDAWLASPGFQNARGDDLWTFATLTRWYRGLDPEGNTLKRSASCILGP